MAILDVKKYSQLRKKNGVSSGMADVTEVDTYRQNAHNTAKSVVGNSMNNTLSLAKSIENSNRLKQAKKQQQLESKRNAISQRVKNRGEMLNDVSTEKSFGVTDRFVRNYASGVNDTMANLSSAAKLVSDFIGGTDNDFSKALEKYSVNYYKDTADDLVDDLSKADKWYEKLADFSGNIVGQNALNTVFGPLGKVGSVAMSGVNYGGAVGRAYDEALDSGVDPATAKLYALAEGGIEGLIEDKLGVDELLRGKGGTSALKDIYSAAMGEGFEEVLQGLTNRTAQNIGLGYDNPIVSLEDDNAILNPLTSAKEFSGGFIGGGLLGAGASIMNGSLSNDIKKATSKVKNAFKKSSDLEKESGYFSKNDKGENVLNAAAPDGTVTSDSIDNVTFDSTEQADMYKYASTLDTATANRFLQNYKENYSHATPKAYTEAYRAYYDSGVTGLFADKDFNLEKTIKKIEGNPSLKSAIADDIGLSLVDRALAYQEGYNKAQAKLQADLKAVPTFTSEQIKNAEFGVINRKDDAFKNMSKEMRTVVSAIAKTQKVKVVVVDNITSNGFYDRDNEIVYLNSKSQNPASYLLGHEMTHRNAYISPAEHKEFSDYTLNVLKKKDLATFNKNFNETKKLYETALNKTFDESYIYEEIVANSTAKLFNDADFVEGLVKQNRSLAQKILDFIKDLIGKITGKGFKITEKYTIREAEMLSEADAKDLQEIRRLFEKALAKTKERVTTATETDTEAQKNTDSKTEGERFSLSTTDSQGNTLTEQQREYFKDSKVVDENGNLMVMYHQTEGDFTEFNTHHKGAGSYDYETPYGVFLKPSSADIGLKGSKQMKLYANITNPLRVSDRSELNSYLKTNHQYADAVAEVDKANTYYKSKFDEAKENFKNYLIEWRNNNPEAKRSDIYKDNKFNEIYDAEEKVIEEWTEKINVLSEKAKKLVNDILVNDGYDGVIISTDKGSFGRSTKTVIALNSNQVKNLDNKNPTADKDIRFSLPQNAEENKAYSKLVEKHFGTTYNWNETGYLLRNGKKLDFSGKNNGAPKGYRSIDHRDINEAFFDVETFIDEGRFTEEDLPNEELVNYLSDLSGTEAMVDFMQRGNIRIMPETGGINLSVEPTSSQYDSLSDFISRNRGEVILDIDDAKGNTIASVEYSRGTHANRVINDIKNYFANGTIPSVSVVSDFHVRYSLPNVDNTVKSKYTERSKKLLGKKPIRITSNEYWRVREAINSRATNNEWLNKYHDIYVFNPKLNIDCCYVVYVTGFDNFEVYNRFKNYDDKLISEVKYEIEQENRIHSNSGEAYEGSEYERGEYGGSVLRNRRSKAVGLASDDSLHEGRRSNAGRVGNSGSKNAGGNRGLKFSLSPDQIAEVGDLNEFEEVLGLESDITESLTEDFNKLVKITKGKTVDKQTVRKTARNFVTRTMTGNYYKGQKFDELVDRLYNVFNYLAESDSVDLGQVSYIMKNIAGDLISHSESKIDLTDEQEAVKKAIREKRIYVPEHIRNGGDFDNYGGFENFRKQHFGKFILTSNPEGATSWDELYETFNEEVGYPIFDKSDSDLTGNSAASVLERLADVYKSLQPAYINPFEDGVLALTNEEQRGLLGWEMLESYFEIAGDVKTESVADSFKKKIEKIKADNKVKREELEKKFKAKYTEGKKAIRDRMKESANKKKYRQRINKDIRDLNNMLLKPTEKKHVPIPLEKPLAEFLKSIDTSSERLNKYGEPTQRTLVWRNLCDFYEQVINGSVEECSSIKFDADMLAEFKELIKRTQAVKLDELNATELKGLSEFIKSIKHSIRNIDKAFSMKKNEEIGALASDFQLYLSENQYFKYKNEKNDFSKSVERFVKYDQLNAVSFFHTLGPVGEKFYSSLQDARDKRAVNIEKARNYAKEVLKEIDIKSIQGKNAKTFVFDVEGQELRLTTGDIMTIRGLYKRQQAKRHLTNGGITLKLQKTKEAQEGKKLKKKVYFKQYDALNLNVNVLSEMFSKLTAEEIKAADKLQNFLSQECSEWGNEVSENLYGYKKYTESNYFPIETNKDFIHSKEGGQGNSLENILEHSSFTKATVINAANPLVIRNFMDVWVDHVERIASYNAYVPVLTDMNRFINHSSSTHFVGDDGETIRTNYKSIKTSMKKAYGVTDNGERSNAEDYWHNLVLDINGAGRNDNSTPSKLLAFLNSNAKVASIGLNPRVVIQQPTAILRAGTEIEPTYLLKALTKGHGKAEVNRMLEICPIAMIKMYGGSDINTGKTTSEILLDNQSTYSKIKEKSMYFAGKADEVAWVHLFKAVELKVQKTHPEYEVDSAEYKQAVNEMFRNIIDKTQVVDSVLNRSKLMRSKNEMVKASTNFMSEPTVMYNMMYRAGFDAKIHKKGAFKNGGRTIGFILVSVIANAFAKSLVDALRDDDDEKSYGEKYVNALIGDYSDKEKGFMKEFILKSNIGGELNVFNWIPFIKDAFSIAQGYDNERLEMSGYSDVVSSVMRTIEYCYDAHKGEANKLTSGAVIVQLAKGMSKATGLPISNVIREITSLDDDLIYAFKENGMNSPELEYNLKSLAYQKNKANSSMYSKIAIEARSNGDITFMNHIRNDLIEGGMKPSEIKESFKSAATSILKEDKTMEALYKAVKNHDYDEAEKYEKELLGRHFTEEEIKSALTYFKNKAKEDKEEPEEVDTGKYESKPSSIYTYEDMAYAFLNGDKSYEDIRADLIEVSTAKDPEGTVNSQLKSKLRQIYKDSFHTNEELRKKTWRALKKLGYSDEDIIAITKNK